MLKTGKSATIPGILLVIAGITIGVSAHRVSRPSLPEFAESRQQRIRILYIPGTPVASRIPELSAKIRQNISQAESDLRTELPEWKIYLYNDWEEKGAAVEDIRIAGAENSSDSLHCIVNREVDGLRERPEYQVLVAKKLGKPFAEEWTEFTGVALAGVWNQKTLQQWAEFLISRNLKPAFPDFFTNRSISPYWRTPWNAIFLRFLTQEFGHEAMTRFYQKGTAPPNYESAWQKHLATLGTGVRRAPLQDGQVSAKREFHKGISFAYSNGYETGYATRKSRESLDRLKAHGVTWVASIPYGYMRSPQSVTIGRMGNSIVGEADEAMIALARDARNRGMKVMLKPQIWISHNSWPGKIDFPGDVLWSQWMKSYENWILHYAILSELTRADLFCIGTEFVNATTKQPALWRNLIRRIRQVYGGPLVYAANYGKEFEELSFWKDLDYIGLDNYYQVRKSEKEGLAEMRQGFLLQRDRIKAVSLRYGKPVLFTEIGYMANTKAGMGHREYETAEYDETMQKSCYELAMETYWNEPWFTGMYWWKWFSDPDDRGRGADPHSPHDRLAGNVLKEWYGRK